VKKDDGTVKSAKVLRVFERFRKRNRYLKTTVDEATCRVIEKGLVERQKGRGYERTEIRTSAT